MACIGVFVCHYSKNALFFIIILSFACFTDCPCRDILTDLKLNIFYPNQEYLNPNNFKEANYPYYLPSDGKILFNEIIKKDSLNQNFDEDTAKLNQNINFEYSIYSNTRNGYFFITIGLLDIFGFGFGYQINKNYAVGIKWSDYWLSDMGDEGLFPFPDNGGGFGVRISRTMNYQIINNLNFEVLLFYTVSHRSYKQFIKGAAFDINIGDESKMKNGFNFIWSVGFVVSCAKGVPTLYMPNLKIGFNINY